MIPLSADLSLIKEPPEKKCHLTCDGRCYCRDHHKFLRNESGSSSDKRNFTGASHGDCCMRKRVLANSSDLNTCRSEYKICEPLNEIVPCKQSVRGRAIKNEKENVINKNTMRKCKKRNCYYCAVELPCEGGAIGDYHIKNNTDNRNIYKDKYSYSISNNYNSGNLSSLSHVTRNECRTKQISFSNCTGCNYRNKSSKLNKSSSCTTNNNGNSNMSRINYSSSISKRKTAGDITLVGSVGFYCCWWWWWWNVLWRFLLYLTQPSGGLVALQHSRRMFLTLSIATLLLLPGQFGATVTAEQLGTTTSQNHFLDAECKYLIKTGVHRCLR